MDGSKKGNHLRNLNKYSWLILVTFILAVLAMSYRTTNIFFDGFIQTLPLIIVFVFWSEKSARLIKQAESNLKKSELFNRDMFILSFSFLWGCLISLLFAYDNSDVKGWWVLIIYFISLYGLIFSLTFSGIALQVKNHKRYTLVFSLLIIIFVSMGKFLPHHTFIPLLGYIDTFYAITCILLIIHCLFAINCKITKVVKMSSP
jgi:hypothetical protein